MSALLYRIKRNPVLVLTVLVAVLDATQGLGFRQALIVAGGILARNFTVPASEVDDAPEEASS